MALMAMGTDNKLLDDVKRKAESYKLFKTQLAMMLNVKPYHLTRIFSGVYTEEEWLSLVKFTNMDKGLMVELIRAQEIVYEYERKGLPRRCKGTRFRNGDEVYSLIHAIEHKYGNLSNVPMGDIHLQAIHALTGVYGKIDIYDKGIVEQLRCERGLSRTELSEAVGYHRTWYKQFQNGTHFSMDHALLFASYFGVKLSYFERTDWGA